MAETSPLRNRHDEYARSLRALGGGRGGGVSAGGGVISETESAPMLLQAHVETIGYGPPGQVTEIVATWGLVEAEYAAIRRGAGLMDRPERGVILVRGADRLDFLNRMLTQDLKALAGPMALDRPGVEGQVGGQVGGARSFWLNRKGRIDADLMVKARGEDILIDVDAHLVDATAKSLGSYVFTEDVAFEDARRTFHRLSIHGLRAWEVLQWASAGGMPAPPVSRAPVPPVGGVWSGEIAGSRVHAVRFDDTGEIGLELFVPRESVVGVWDALLGADDALAQGKRRIRPIGWYAYNVARIEHGTPLFNVDFGSTNLPHETGAVDQRVSFTKGCYLGQEVVSRMHHLGKPRQQLVGLRIDGDGLPVAEAQVFALAEAPGAADPAAPPGPQVGVVTSSTLSPMLGAAPVAFAMVRSSHAATGTRVLVHAEGAPFIATVQPLRFWPVGKEGES